MLLATLYLSTAAALSSQGGATVPLIENIQATIERGDLTTAARELKAALVRYPKSAGLLNLSGVIHAQRSEAPQARADFEQAVRLDSGLMPAWRNLARVCTAGEGPETLRCASDAWEHVLKTSPADAEARTALAAVYEWQGKFADSLRVIGSLSAEDASRSAMLALRCADLAGLARAPEATAAAQALVRMPDYSEADAAAILPVLDPSRNAPLLVTLIEPLDKSGKASTEILRKLALAYEQMERLAEARQVLERLALTEPDNPAHLLELARIAYRSHDREGALTYLGHARDLQPNDARTHFLFGVVALEMELPVEARRSLEKAVALDPRNPDYYYALGGVLLSGGVAAEAVPIFAKYVAARPEDPRGHFALGASYFAALDYERCRAEMSIIAKNPKTEAGAAYFLGRVARMEENYVEAETQLERAIQLAPSFAEAYTEMARVRIGQGKLSEARTAVDRAIQLDRDSFAANSALLTIMQMGHDADAEGQAAHLRALDAERSRRRELLMRTIEVRPY